MDARTHQGRSNGLAQSSDHGVIFRDDNEASWLAACRYDRFGVKRLDGRHMQNGRLDFVDLKTPCGLQRAHRQESRRYEQYVRAVSKQARPAEHKLVTVFVEHQRHLSAQQSHVDWTLMAPHRRNCLLDFIGVAWNNTI